ncbi:hypothetical protein MMC13_001011 [Lambiella insularis]|nr:hypothetical protein [Lambiella insularis]
MSDMGHYLKSELMEEVQCLLDDEVQRLVAAKTKAYVAPQKHQCVVPVEATNSNDFDILGDPIWTQPNDIDLTDPERGSKQDSIPSCHERELVPNQSVEPTRLNLKVSSSVARPSLAVERTGILTYLDSDPQQPFLEFVAQSISPRPWSTSMSVQQFHDV